MSADTVLLIGSIAGLVLLCVVAWRAYIFRAASKTAKQLFPVWAGQGPFDSGEDSARAMKAAYTVVLGPEEAEHDRHPSEAWRARRIDVVDRGKDQDGEEYERGGRDPLWCVEGEYIEGDDVPIRWKALEVSVVGLCVRLTEAVCAGHHDGGSDRQVEPGR